MSAGTFICGAMKQSLAVLRNLKADPAMLQRTAEAHGIKVKTAAYYVDAEIRAKEAGL